MKAWWVCSECFIARPSVEPHTCPKCWKPEHMSDTAWWHMREDQARIGVVRIPPPIDPGTAGR